MFDQEKPQSHQVTLLSFSSNSETPLSPHIQLFRPYNIWLLLTEVVIASDFLPNFSSRTLISTVIQLLDQNSILFPFYTNRHFDKTSEKGIIF